MVTDAPLQRMVDCLPAQTTGSVVVELFNNFNPSVCEALMTYNYFFASCPGLAGVSPMYVHSAAPYDYVHVRMKWLNGVCTYTTLYYCTYVVAPVCAGSDLPKP